MQPAPDAKTPFFLFRWRTAGLALLLTGVLLAVVWPELPYMSEDGPWYLRMAEGQGDRVPSPYAGRIVHTGLARLLVGLGMTSAWSFVVIGTVAMWVTLVVAFGLRARRGLSAPGLMALMGTLGAAHLLRDATLPDVHAAAWLATVLALTAWRAWWALPVLVLAIVCRESLALVGPVLAIMAWRQGRRRLAFGALVATAVGLGLVSSVTGDGNIHHLRGWLYLPAKSAFNLLRNVLGLEPWTSTRDSWERVWTWQLPAWIPAGEITEVGFCGFRPLRPAWLLTSLVCWFGVAPGWLLGRRRTVARCWAEAPLWAQVALVYGVLAALLTPAEGTQVWRLFGYAWPAVWLALPALAGGPRERRLTILIAHWLAGWVLPLLAWRWSGDLAVVVAVGMAGLALNGWVLGAGRAADDPWRGGWNRGGEPRECMMVKALASERPWSRRWCFNHMFVLVGAALVAGGFNLFVIPHDVVPGGVVGIAQIVNELTGWPVGLVSLAINLPLLVVASRLMGPRYGAKTFLAMLVIGVGVDALAHWRGTEPLLHNELVSVIFGGVAIGNGLALVLRGKGNAGGTPWWASCWPGCCASPWAGPCSTPTAWSSAQPCSPGATPTTWPMPSSASSPSAAALTWPSTAWRRARRCW